MNNSLVNYYYSRKQKFTFKHYYHNVMNEEARNFAKNLELLMKYHKDTQATLAKKSGVSQKTISNMLNPGDEKSPNLKNVAMIANTYKIKLWHILYPNANLDLLINSGMEKFIQNYASANTEERQAWAHIAEITAKYKSKTETG